MRKPTSLAETGDAHAMMRRAPVSRPHPRDDDHDVALLAAALAGDARAVTTIYDHHAAPLFRLAACLLESSSHAEPVVEDVLVHACTIVGAVRTDRSSLRSELVRLTYRRLGYCSRRFL